jgi:hypothetical protein
MSLRSEILAILQNNLSVAYRSPRAMTVALSPITLFTITGAVELITLGMRTTAAPGGAGTFTLTANGVGLDAGAVLANGAVGTIFLSPLNVAGANLDAAGLPKTVATLTSFISGDSVGTIVVTVAVATITGEWFCVYRKLTPASLITPT